MAQKNDNSSSGFIFGKINYILMIGGLVIVLAGFLLMVGGATEDPNVFNAEEKYSFQRITLAPIIVLIGLLIEVFAIMLKPQD